MPAPNPAFQAWLADRFPAKEPKPSARIGLLSEEQAEKRRIYMRAYRLANREKILRREREAYARKKKGR